MQYFGTDSVARTLAVALSGGGSGGGAVDSVNGKTGNVVLTANDVHALPNTTVVPTKTSDLTNDSGFIDESALDGYAKTEDVPTNTSDLVNDSGFIDETYHDSTKQDVLTAGTNITIDENNVISASGGGSAEGAVRYDETQTLTDQQQMQARANQGLPYISYQLEQIKNNVSFVNSQSAGTVTSWWYISEELFYKLKTVGTKFYITIKNESSNPTATETVECETVSSQGYKVISDTTNLNFFDETVSSVYFATQNIRIQKKDTTESTDWNKVTVYADVSVSSPTYNNKLNSKLIDSMLLSKALITESTSPTTYNSTVCIDDKNTAPESLGFVKIGSNKSDCGQGSVCIGYENNSSSQWCNVIGDRNTNQGSSSTLIGKDSTNYIVGASLLGDGLDNKDSKVVLGFYNVSTPMYSSSTQYHVGDVVCYNYAGYLIYKCIQDCVNTSPSNSEYWERIGSQTNALVLGNGNGFSDRSNAFTVDWSGNGVFAGTVTPTGADYCEYFEWLDGNPDNEDRMGYLVSLDGKNIVMANGDDILGITSGTKAVIGDSYEMNWEGKYVKDELGRCIYEDYDIEHPAIIDPETGEEIEPAWTEHIHTRKISPDYDPTRQYRPRSKRKEWYPVGLLGKLYVRDDGTCEVNGYIKADNGIATKSEDKTNMRVLERVNDHIIRVLVK